MARVYLERNGQDAFGIEQGCLLRLAYAALDLDTATEAMKRFVAGLRATCGNVK